MEAQSPTPPRRFHNGEVRGSPGAERRRVLVISISVMTLVALAVGTIFIVRLYRTAFEQHRQHLADIVESQARLIEAVARFGMRFSAEDVEGGSWAATLSQIEDAHARFPGIGETGELLLARQDGDEITFLLTLRHAGLGGREPIISGSELAEPMRRALAGESGTVIGLDYRGETVLAAYQPVAMLDVGIVAKIDLVEIRAPFIRTGLVAAGGALAIIALGGTLILLGVNPLIQRLERRTEELSTAYDRLTGEISERVEAEDALRELARTLEQRVTKRTAELAASRTAALNMMQDAEESRDNLARMATELARSNADLEQFAYVASHDLQEPLRMISSFTQLLAEEYHGKLDADADDFIDFACDGARRMQQMIQDLLDYSRIGRCETAYEATDTGAVVGEVLDALCVTIAESGAVINQHSLPTVRADHTQLARVFQNLLGNAMKFRSNGKPEIDIGAEHRDHEWMFWVRDNGPGIDPQYAERIFMIFQQLQSQSVHGGTGIGLAICKRIVERDGGRIWVESAPGKGSTFYFTIPDRA